MISCQGGGAGHSSASQYLRSDDGASDNTPSGRDVLAKADKDELDAADKTYQELKSSSDTAFANLKDWDKQISADTINVKTGQKIDQEGGDNCKNETFMTELNDAKNALVTSKKSSGELEFHLRSLLAKNAKAAVEADMGNILRDELALLYRLYRDPINLNYTNGLSFYEKIRNKCNIINPPSSEPNTP